jgi:Holliday junction resolvasome RuvABC endonuclease subunit
MILGIDQSLTATGLCLIENDLTIVDQKTVDTSEMRGMKRIEHILKEIDEFIQKMSGNKLTIVREGYSYQSRSNSAFQLGELGGSINLLVYGFLQEMKKNDIDVRLLVLPPATVKKFCLNSGSVKKDTEYLLKVFKKTGIEFTDDNQADAFMLAKTAVWFIDMLNDVQIIDVLNSKQRESLVPTSLKKKYKISNKDISKMSSTRLQELLREALDSVYSFL